jgi:SAM-dependent methyltransferase
MAEDREQLRKTFDSAASMYDRARPGYPAELYDDLERIAELRAGDHLLEVGCATGKATAPLAQRGYRITCIELGSELAEVARTNLAEFEAVSIINASFEDWDPEPGSTFDLIFAATAWHWIKPEIRYQKAAQLLRPEGHLAFWSARHVVPEGGDRFFQEIQDVYDEIGEGLCDDVWPKPGELADSEEEIEASGLFDVVAIRHFDWEVTYDADAYLRLLDTFSGHIAMATWKRHHLYSEIRRRLAARPERRLRRHWGAVLHVARRSQ